MVRYGVYDVVKCLNIFPPKARVSKTYSLRAILTTKPLDYKKVLKMSFESYGQVIHETNPKIQQPPGNLVSYIYDN